MSPARKAAPRRGVASLGAKLVLGTTTVLVLSTALLYLQLTSKERLRLLAAKRDAAVMVAGQLAGSLSAPLDFGDEEALARELENLRSNTEIVAASVWAAANPTPISRFERGADAGSRAPEVAGDGVDVSDPRWLRISRIVAGRKGQRIGTATVVFSLAREHRAFAETKRRLFLLSLLMATGTGSVLIFMARRQVIRPLAEIVAMARRLEHGDMGARVVVKTQDEIGALAHAFNTMGDAVADRQRRMQAEMDLAARIQTSILPKAPAVPGLEISGFMRPASEVGGDYYDVLPVPGGCWLGIGDVAGHGLDSGLVMLMIQSGVSVLVHQDEPRGPKDVLCALNGTLTENVRGRLGRDDHATLTLLRYFDDGRLVFAGAHEDLLVYRAATKTIEPIETPGTWVAMVPSIKRATVETEARLEPGDVLLLYTDGMVEGKNSAGQLFGVERLGDALAQSAGGSAERICERLVAAVDAFIADQDDDMTVLVVRRQEARHS